MLGWALGLVVWLWSRTLRVTVVGRWSPEPSAGPLVATFFHGQQMPLLALARRRATAVMVSLSADGELQAAVMRVQGLRVVRGSSSRRGAAALRCCLRLLRAGAVVALAVDGPRGPRGTPKAGALTLARRGQAALVPVASACRWAWTLRGSWDQFEVPLPFSRVCIALGEPLPWETATLEELQVSIERQRALACAVWGGRLSAPEAY